MVRCGVVTTPSSQQAIKILRNLFATHGLPEMVVSDNGSAFTSAEFQTMEYTSGVHYTEVALLLQRAIHQGSSNTT